jgi:tetratricopeptide (TPR) repeat protein
MKKILLSIVLGVTAVATAPAQAQSAAPAQAAPSAQGPVIKDPAEYNAYVAAVGQKDPNAKISGLEAFLTQYPNSVMKDQALEILMQTYQQAGNIKKAMETATRLVASSPCHVPALTLLTYVNRTLAQSGDANGKQESADAEKFGQQGLDCLDKFPKPEGTSDEDFKKMKLTMKSNFDAGVGWGALQEKDYAKAAQYLKQALDDNPPDSQKDLSLLYPLTLAYLQQTPPNYQDGIWYGARAAAVAPPQSAPGIENYVKGQYRKFHAGDDGWTEFYAAAKAGGPQVPVPPAPTPADQARKMVQETSPDKMDFATWEFVLTNGAQADKDAVWNAIKGRPVAMNGTIISTTPTEFLIAGSSDDIDAKKADITLRFEDKVPARLIPKDGASFDFQGEPASYTTNPFMMILEKGRLVNVKPAAGAHKSGGAAHRPAQ